jgi:hypothetical protein
MEIVILFCMSAFAGITGWGVYSYSVGAAWFTLVWTLVEIAYRFFISPTRHLKILRALLVLCAAFGLRGAHGMRELRNWQNAAPKRCRRPMILGIAMVRGLTALLGWGLARPLQSA